MLSLTYLSSASELLDEPALVQILAESRPRNHERGLTGMLLYSDGNIIQVLEGPDDAVEETFRTISADPRHHGILIALRDPITTRAFPDWSMGFRSVRREELRQLPGFSEFLAPDGRGSDLGDQAAPAYQLLEIFRDSMR